MSPQQCSPRPSAESIQDRVGQCMTLTHALRAVGHRFLPSNRSSLHGDRASALPQLEHSMCVLLIAARAPRPLLHAMPSKATLLATACDGQVSVGGVTVALQLSNSEGLFAPSRLISTPCSHPRYNPSRLASPYASPASTPLAIYIAPPKSDTLSLYRQHSCLPSVPCHTCDSPFSQPSTPAPGETTTHCALMSSRALGHLVHGTCSAARFTTLSLGPEPLRFRDPVCALAAC